MAVTSKLFVLLAVVTSVPSALAIARPPSNFGWSARSGKYVENTCTKDQTRCAGAKGYPYVHYAPCCTDGYMCLADEELGWGKWCVKPSKEQYAKCYLNNKRCTGAPGKPYIPYHKCCGGGKCVEDETLGWGKFCKGGSYGNDYEVSDYKKDYEVVKFKYDEKKEEEKEEEEKEGYKEYVEKYEKKYYEDEEDSESDSYAKGYGYKSYGHGLGHENDKKVKVFGKTLGGKKMGISTIKHLFAVSGAKSLNANPFCLIPGEDTAEAGVKSVTVQTGSGSASGEFTLNSASICGATAATFPLRVLVLIEQAICGTFLTLVPTGSCGISAVSDGTIMRMALSNRASMDVSVRQGPGSPAVVIRCRVGFPCSSRTAALAALEGIGLAVTEDQGTCPITTPDN